MTPPALSVVIPVRNEQENLIPLWAELSGILGSLRRTWEVLLVDDGSTDGSRVAIQDSTVRMIPLDRPRGKTAALWTGFRHSRAEIVLTMDADLQNDPRDIPTLLAALTEADLVVGWRKERRDSGAKRIASRIANRFRTWMTGDRTHDAACPLKAFRRSVLPHLPPFDGMHRFYSTLAALAGFRVVEVPVRHRPRRFGTSKYGIWDRTVGPLADCLAVRWMQRRYIGGSNGWMKP